MGRGGYDDDAFTGPQAAAREPLEGIQESRVVSVDLDSVFCLGQLPPECAGAGVVRAFQHAEASVVFALAEYSRRNPTCRPSYDVFLPCAEYSSSSRSSPSRMPG